MKILIHRSVYGLVDEFFYVIENCEKNVNFSTRLLTVLTLRAIVQIEQRKRRKGTGNKKKRFPKISNLLSPDKQKVKVTAIRKRRDDLC